MQYCLIESEDGLSIRIVCDEKLERAAMKWSYIVKNRVRWANGGQAREDINARAFRELLELSVDANERKILDLSRSHIVQVRIPYSEIGSPAGRLFPWEFFLSAATKEMRKGKNRDFLVVRHLDKSSERPISSNGLALSVVLSPNDTIEKFDFSSDMKLPNPASSELHEMTNPTVKELTEWVDSNRPTIVHVMGVDVHEFDSFQGLKERRDDDGALFESADADIEFVDSKRLAGIIGGASEKPRIVSYNLHNTASRVAAETVYSGAGCAIGFQDSFDDLAAEVFIGAFYRAYRRPQRTAVSAFRYAWKKLRKSGRRIAGSGVVLWNSNPISFDHEYTAQSDDETFDLDRDSGHSERRPNTSEADVDQEEGSAPSVELKVKSVRNVNYALLHNGRSIFDELTLRRTDLPGSLDVSLEVELDLDSKVQFKTDVTIDESPKGLEREVSLPLLWREAGEHTDGFKTNVRVAVRHKGDVLASETQKVNILPVNEWVDDNENRQFLPSFVFPMDTAVQEVITAAQPYLMSLSDDPSAGFDGYQSIGRLRSGENGVDNQVAAIWSALLHEYDLFYIEPPPSYALGSQRVRTPRVVIDGRRGTCLDITLLLCSCFEYIGIHSVVFLLNGHAFPGYWRDDKDWNAFNNMAHLSYKDSLDLREMISHTGTYDEEASWVFSRYREVLREVEQGYLVPLEAVSLTSYAGVERAMDEGWENLRSQSEFESMIDIGKARTIRNPITPLPRTLRAR